MLKTATAATPGLKFLSAVPAILLASFLFAGCVSSNQGQPPPPQTVYNPMKTAVRKIVADLNHACPVKGKNFQITSSNFYETGTRLNLPFSDQVSSFLSTKITDEGGITSVQEISEKPIRVMGTYLVNETEVILTVMLREMGNANSRDLAKSQTKIKRSQLPDKLFEPRFSRIGNTLVMLLEEHYNGLNSQKINIKKLLPATAADHEMILGRELQKILQHSLTNSDIFSCDTGRDTVLPSTGGGTAVITGQYGIIGEKLNILLQLSGPGNALLSSASYDIPLKNIPKEYLESTIHSLDDLLNDLCRSLSETCQQNGLNLTGESILLKPEWFSDTHENTVLPFSKEITRRLAPIIMEKNRCTVANQVNMNTRWIFEGEYSRNGEAVSVNLTLLQMQPHAAQTGIELVLRASAAGKILFDKCAPAWFRKNFKGTLQCLLNRLERKSLKDIAFRESKKNKLLVKKIKYKDTSFYSPFSDYVNTDTVEYFSNSLVYVPIIDPEQKLRNFRAGSTRSTRGVLPVGVGTKEPEPMAAITGATCYTKGSYWPLHNNQVDIKLNLCTAAGAVICSASISADKNLVDPALFKLPQQNDTAYTQKIALMAPVKNNTPLALKVFTQQGRENLMFKKGDEILFYVHADKDAYLHLYNRDANGDIYRIFPNTFSNGNFIKSEDVTIIPDKNYASGFKFKVQGRLGNEMVFAFASDHPLPDLPGKKVGAGVKAMQVSIDDIKKQFSEFASQRGHFLSWDAIAMYTQP